MFPKEKNNEIGDEVIGRETDEILIGDPIETPIGPPEVKEGPVPSEVEEGASGSDQVLPPPVPSRYGDLPVPPRPAPRYAFRSRGPVADVDWVMPTPTRRRGAPSGSEADTKPAQAVMVQSPTVDTRLTVMDKLVWLVQAMNQ